jgi:hypothetical protein
MALLTVRRSRAPTTPLAAIMVRAVAGERSPPQAIKVGGGEAATGMIRPGAFRYRSEEIFSLSENDVADTP